MPADLAPPRLGLPSTAAARLVAPVRGCRGLLLHQCALYRRRRCLQPTHGAMALAAALARTCGGLRAARRVVPAPRLPRAAAACTTSSDLSPGPAVRRPDTCAGSLPLARRVYSTGAKGGASWALGPHGRFTHTVRSASTARRKHRVKSASSAHSDGSMLLLPSVHGVDVTCASPAAVDLYDEAVSDYLALRGDPVTKLQKVAYATTRPSRTRTRGLAASEFLNHTLLARGSAPDVCAAVCALVR